MAHAGQAHFRHSLHFSNLLRESRSRYLLGGDEARTALEMLDMNWPNVEMGHRWAAQDSDSLNALALRHLYPDGGARLLELRQHPRDQLSWWESARDSANQLREPIIEARAWNNLGMAHEALGDLK